MYTLFETFVMEPEADDGAQAYVWVKAYRTRTHLVAMHVAYVFSFWSARYPTIWFTPSNSHHPKVST